MPAHVKQNVVHDVPRLEWHAADMQMQAAEVIFCVCGFVFRGGYYCGVTCMIQLMDAIRAPKCVG